MPLVVIHLIRDAYTPDQIKAIGDAIYETMRVTFSTPLEDRYQIVTQHERYEMMCSDTNLGYTRTDKFVFLQIVQQGRTDAMKQGFYSAVFEALRNTVRLAPGDLVMSTTANTRADWSFGAGEAQFLTGTL